MRAPQLSRNPARFGIAPKSSSKRNFSLSPRASQGLPTGRNESGQGNQCVPAAAAVEEARLDTGGSSGNFSGGKNGGDRKLTADGDDSEHENTAYNGWNPLLRLWFGMQSRMAADPDFTYKLCVECGIDALIIAAVNKAARGDQFFSELEFVLCQMLVSCSNDFALVYLLAPVAARTSEMPQSAIGRIIRSLPAHVMAYGTFTPAQRIACFLYKAVQYGAVGFTMGIAGTSVVNLLTDVREVADPTFQPPAMWPSALLTGLGWLYFMGVSSNVRYNMISAGEQYLYGTYPGAVSKMGSVALRLANNFVGAYLWVDLAEQLGVSQPRRSLREEAREVERRRSVPWWVFWRRKEPDAAMKFPFNLFQEQLV